MPSFAVPSASTTATVPGVGAVVSIVKVAVAVVATFPATSVTAAHTVYVPGVSVPVCTVAPPPTTDVTGLPVAVNPVATHAVPASCNCTDAIPEYGSLAPVRPNVADAALMTPSFARPSFSTIASDPGTGAVRSILIRPLEVGKSAVTTFPATSMIAARTRYSTFSVRPAASTVYGELVSSEVPRVVHVAPLSTLVCTFTLAIPAPVYPESLGPVTVNVGVATFRIPSDADTPASSLTRKAKVPAPGAVRSTITTVTGLDGSLTFPARSVALAVIWYVPVASVVGIVNVPVAAPVDVGVTVVVAPEIAMAPSNSWTVAWASETPVITWAEALVMPSVLDAPVSVAAVRPTPVGASGFVRSMVNDDVAERAVFPARSVASTRTS